MSSKSSLLTLVEQSKFPLQAVLGACEVLTLLAKRRVLRRIGADPDAETVHPSFALVLWVADLVERMPIPSAEQKLLLTDEFGGPILDYALRFWASLAPDVPLTVQDVPVAQLGLGDRRYVIFTGLKTALDLETGKWIDAGAVPPLLERILYDLPRLFTHRCRHLAEVTYATGGRTSEGS